MDHVAFSRNGISLERARGVARAWCHAESQGVTNLARMPESLQNRRDPPSLAEAKLTDRLLRPAAGRAASRPGALYRWAARVLRDADATTQPKMARFLSRIRTLTPSVLVRIQLPQPNQILKKQIETIRSLVAFYGTAGVPPQLSSLVVGNRGITKAMAQIEARLLGS